MDPVTAAIITGGLGYLSQMSTNDANEERSMQQMQFQERMSSTAHQREVEDLRKAGLNPVLSALGGGASTPVGSALPAVDPSASSNASVNSALSAMRTKADIQNILETNKKLKSEVALNSAATETQKRDAELKDALRAAADADVVLKSNSAKVADANAKTINANLSKAETMGHIWDIPNRIFSNAKSASEGMSRKRPSTEKQVRSYYSMLANSAI